MFELRDLRAAYMSASAERAGKITSHPGEAELVAYYSGELSESRQDELQEHLVACRDCGDRILELDRIEHEEQSAWTRFKHWLSAARAGPIFDGDAAWANPALGAVAAFVLAVLLIGYAGTPWQIPADSFDAYLLEVRGDQMRGGAGERNPDEVFRFAHGSTLQIVLHPEEPVTGAVEVETYIEHAGTLTPWSAPIRVWEEGAARIKGRVGEDVTLPPGESDLYVVVGRPGQLPAAAELQRRLATSQRLQKRDWAAWRVHVALSGPRAEQ